MSHRVVCGAAGRKVERKMGEMTRSDPDQLRAAITHVLEHTEEAVRLPDALRFGGSDESRARAVQEAAAELIGRHDGDRDADRRAGDGDGDGNREGEGEGERHGSV
jgi:hypothetical protein